MCVAETGKKPIGTRWVDTNKVDATNPKVRSRLVAQEINRSKMPELFAATPPLEYIKYLISLCASSQWSKNPTRLMISDVKKAYFYAAATRRIYMALPAEDIRPGEEAMCGMLERSLYGTRDAAYNWTQTYTKVLCESLGFEKGASSPSTFYHHQRQLKTVVHGDDFFTEGTPKELKQFDKDFKEHFEMKTEILGPDAESGEVREVRFLNRVLTWNDQGISWEADPRHAEMVVKQLGLDGARVAATPGTKEDNKAMIDDSQCPGAIDEVMAMNEDATARPVHIRHRDAGDEVLAFIHEKGDWPVQGTQDMLTNHDCIGVDDALIPHETMEQAMDRLFESGRKNLQGKLLSCEPGKGPEVTGQVFYESTRGSPPDADDARREKPAVYDEEWQGGFSNAKLVDQHQLMLDDGWEHITCGRYRKEVRRATRFPTPPIEGMVRRITKEARSKKLMEDMELSEARVLGTIRTNRIVDARIDRAMKAPQDIDVEVEILAMDEDAGEGNPLQASLPPKEASLYRAIVAIINFLAADRAELQFASKECSRRMSNPRLMDWGNVKRIGRYLLGRPRAVQWFYWQDEPGNFTVFSDSNWAGRRDTRKSTSGAALMHGGHLLKSFSRTQSNIALSSAEAELYATVTAASEGMGLTAMAKDYGKVMVTKMQVDATAAIGIAE